MSITDELREWFKDRFFMANGWQEIHDIADRIDAEHERLMRERRGCIHYDQERHYCNVHDLTTEDYKRGYDDGFASADDWLGQHESDMAEHGWIRLPKDADGEPIHVGDVMEWPTTGDTFEVVGIGEGTLFYVEDGSDYADWTGASTKRHHHKPTVEDVLTEFGIDWEHESDCEDRAALLKEYAAKLRLAEGEDA